MYSFIPLSLPLWIKSYHHYPFYMDDFDMSFNKETEPFFFFCFFNCIGI